MTPLVHIRHAYFWLFSFVGIFATFASPYFKSIGLSGTEIGVIGAISPIMMVVMPSVFGAVADKRGNTTGTFRFVMFAAMFTMLAFPFAASFWPVFVMIAAMSFFRTSSGALLDSLTLTLSEKNGGDFGAVRLWGSIGFVTTSLIVGVIADLTSLTSIAWAMVVALVMGAFVSLWLPTVARERSDNVLKDLAEVLQNRDFMLFLLSVFANRFAATAPLIFYPIMLKEAHYSNVFVALFWVMGVGAEIIYFRFAPILAARFGASRIAVVATLGIVVHFGLFLVVSAPAWILVIQTLHALTFGAFYYTGVTYVARVVPRRMRAGGQALFAAAGFGVAGGLSSLCGGAIFDRYRGEGVLWFAVAAGVLAVAATIPVAERLTRV
ncbi:MAG: MFS transporter [Myxococcales bacterium]|nr:MFS transporter [Myxococcales bacterium]